MKRQFGKVNLSSWTFTATENLVSRAADDVEKLTAHYIGYRLADYVTSQFIPLVESVAEEVIETALESDDTYCFLPAKYSPHGDGVFGPPVEDPLTIYIRIALGNGIDEAPVWKTSINEMIDDDDLAQAVIDGSHRIGLTRIRDGLRVLADRIDAALSGPQTKKS